MPAEHFEIAVVGGGKGGKTLAAKMASAGSRAVMIEKGMIGGTCIHVACIPTKTMVKSAKVAELAKSGPLNNQVLIEKRVPMHIAYFTAWVDEKGALKTYSDIYGHEKRVAQALDGKWEQIAKGRDHLAPVVPDQAHLEARPQKQAARQGRSANDDFLGSFFGGF